MINGRLLKLILNSMGKASIISLFSKASQDGARGSAVAAAAGIFQREAGNFIVSRRDFAEVQTFHDHDIFFEQCDMRRKIFRTEFFHREIVYSGQLYAVIRQNPRRRGRNIGKIRPETVFRGVPKSGISRLEQNPLDAAQISQMPGFYSIYVARDLDHAAFSDQRPERDL